MVEPLGVCLWSSTGFGRAGPLDLIINQTSAVLCTDGAIGEDHHARINCHFPDRCGALNMDIRCMFASQ